MSKHTLLVASVALLNACAIVSGEPVKTAGIPTRMMNGMATAPPGPRAEEAPALSPRQAWVPGYYEAIGGQWIWISGTVVTHRDGYSVRPASHVIADGRYQTVRPSWTRTAFERSGTPLATR